MTSTIRACLVALLAFGLAACGAVAQHQTVGALEVSVPWSRAIPPGAPVAAGFVTIRNTADADDRLVEVLSDAAERVEIHEVRHEDGMARMRQLKDGLPLPGDETVVLKPGGYHLMFIAPRDGFVASGKVVATLVFEKAGRLDVAFDVRSLGATEASDDAGHAHH